MLMVAVASQAAYRETLVTDGGTINGYVRVVGDIAPLPPQPVFKEKDYCGETVVDERLVTDPAGGVPGPSSIWSTWQRASPSRVPTWTLLEAHRRCAP